MPNPYLTAALRAQDHERPKRAPKTPEAPASEKAVESAAKSSSTADKENN